MLVGYISSLLGIGGGIIHVPVLVQVLNFPIHIATATSHFVLAVMSLCGTIVHITTGVLSKGILQTIALSIGVLFGARLYYVAFEWTNYKNNLLEIFNIRQGGLAIYGGILTAVITTYIFTKKRKMSVWKFIDFLIPYVALAQSMGRWGNFVNQEANGIETTLPWRMEIFDSVKMQRIAVHPTFLYESLWNLGLFLFLIRFRKKKKLDGEVFTLYLALYGFARFFIEELRTDSLYIGTFRVSQMLAGLFFLAGISIYFIRRYMNIKSNI